MTLPANVSVVVSGAKMVVPAVVFVSGEVEGGPGVVDDGTACMVMWLWVDGFDGAGPAILVAVASEPTACCLAARKVLETGTGTGAG